MDQVICILNVYAPKRTVDNRGLWERILSIKESNNGLWILLGDFNSVRSMEERRNSVFIHVCARDFNDFIFNANLSEFNMKGGKFTFSIGNKCSKLDRVLVCPDFLNRWPEACLKVLPKFLSDHRPIVLYTKFANFGPKLFRFFNSWLKRKGIDEVVKKAWHQFQMDGPPDLKLILKLKCVRDEIRKWWEEVKTKEMEEFSILKDEFEKLENMAEQRDLNEEENWVRLECVKGIKDMEFRKSLDLKQKSRIRWASMGDENTSFFSWNYQP
ncbi:uncharacterized protein LOC143607350 [Bidens hawaiensis]|uniref:uncharacterized protein LOC143607350 n=1 Tax=Bidens hawaiensis TaxID=980011 RepID=UPI00404A78F6